MKRKKEQELAIQRLTKHHQEISKELEERGIDMEGIFICTCLSAGGQIVWGGDVKPGVLQNCLASIIACLHTAGKWDYDETCNWIKKDAARRLTTGKIRKEEGKQDYGKDN